MALSTPERLPARVSIIFAFLEKVGNRLIFHPKFFLQVGCANFVVIIYKKDLAQSTFMFIFTRRFEMKKNVLIELLEDGGNVGLYSPRFEGEQYTEFEKFLLRFKDQYPEDVRQIVYRLDIVKREGAEDRYFRYEGAMTDRVMALPSHLETTRLRLYLLNIQSKVIILGDGGLKKTATYQEDRFLRWKTKGFWS